MPDPLDSLRHLIDRPADAVRWACLLEATAPKAGSVSPGRSFDNLTYVDFITAAEIASRELAPSGQRISQRIFRVIDETASQIQTNVNLGIVLLLGPLIAADELLCKQELTRTSQNWVCAIGEVLRGLDDDDGQQIFRAIKRASAGGLGKVDSMDVHQSSGPVNLLGAMHLAKDRDRIARNYSTRFNDLIQNVVPVVADSLDHCGDLLFGISRAHLRLLAQEPDSLIARKNGLSIAIEVQKRAAALDLDDSESVAEFDASLRTAGHEFNPGTTADLLAAALYVLLRSPNP